MSVGRGLSGGEKSRWAMHSTGSVELAVYRSRSGTYGRRGSRRVIKEARWAFGGLGSGLFSREPMYVVRWHEPAPAPAPTNWLATLPATARAPSLSDHPSPCRKYEYVQPWMLAIPRILIAVLVHTYLPDRWRTLFRARNIEYRALHPELSNQSSWYCSARGAWSRRSLRNVGQRNGT